jgi:hypothetical protein
MILANIYYVANLPLVGTFSDFSFSVMKYQDFQHSLFLIPPMRWMLKRFVCITVNELAHTPQTNQNE